MTTTQVDHDPGGWTADDSTFGARLALVRQRMHWGNVKEAAAACGLPTESWRSWERDNRAPRNVVQIAATIADRTGCDYGWLLTGPRLREGRLIATAAATQDSARVSNARKTRPPNRPYPTGRPKPMTPDDATRRPVRRTPVHA